MNIKNIFNNIETTDQYPNEELFPFACYLDERTVITHNGELVQIIKIPSFMTNTSSDNLFKLRADLQNCLVNTLKIDNINYWFHVVRKHVDITPHNQEYTNYFSKNINQKWNDKNNFSKQYTNEIYISIILGKKNKIDNFLTNLIQNISFSRLKRIKKNAFNETNKILTNITNKILEDLQEYKPQVLKIIKIDNHYYSEHCKFFSLIINNDRKLFPLDNNILGYGLSNKKIVYGSNILQIFDNETNTYISLVSLKNYNNLLLSELDKIIQLDEELIITQTISVLHNKDWYAEQIKEQYETLNTIEDSEIKTISGYGALVDDLEKSNKNLLISQVLIQVKGSSVEEVDKNTSALFNVLKKIGLVAVREEMFLPTLFWSQLPANFSYIERLKIIPIDQMCQFISLYNFPAGRLTNNKWGDAVLVLKSTINTPYFFSFHNNNTGQGNTLIVGPNNDYRTTILNFLISESTKQVDRIFYIDTLNKSKVFINALNGKYYELSNQENSKKDKLILNPFETINDETDINFVINWLHSILKINDSGFIQLGNKKTVLQSEIEQFDSMIKENISNIKMLKDVTELVKNNGLTEIYQILKDWDQPENGNFIFNDINAKDIFSDTVVGFNFGNLVNNDKVKVIALKYLLYRIYSLTSEESRTIIAINEVWNLFDNEYMANEFLNIIKKFSSKNTIFVCTTSGSDFFENSYLKTPVGKHFATSILLQNMKTSVYQKKIFNINEQEAKLLSIIKDECIFLIRNNKSSLFAKIDFDFLSRTEKSVFNSDVVAVNAMYKAKELTKSNDPEVWIPEIEKILSAYYRYVTEQQLKEQEKRQIEWQESREQLSVNKVE